MLKNKMMRLTVLALAIGCPIASHSALAAEVFNVTGTVVGGTTQTRSFGFSSAEDVLAFPNNLQNYFSNYVTQTEAATVNVDYRGLGMTTSFANLSNDLVFVVPSLGITQTFSGANRHESQRLFSDFMKKNGGAILNQIMKKLVEVSPHDPIAGNPNSLMSQMVASDFANGFFSLNSNIAGKGDEKPNNLIGIGVRVSSIRQEDGLRNNSMTLPFSYTVRADIDPRRQLIFNAPLTYTEVGGAKAYNLGFGAAYRTPMNDNWTLTPALNYGAAGSKDLGAFGQAVSASITSSYVINGNGYDLVIGNMVGYYRTLKLSAGDYSYNPDIANLVFRNGVMYSQPINAFGKKMSIEYSLIDTRFTGTALYNEGYDEIGITLGTNKSASSARSFLRAGANVLFGPKTKGFSLNVGYWF